MQRKVFLGITPPEYLLKKKRTLTLHHPFRFSTFCRENLSLAGCSSAEPASVSVQQTKFKSENYIYNLFNFPATFRVTTFGRNGTQKGKDGLKWNSMALFGSFWKYCLIRKKQFSLIRVSYTTL